MDEYLLMNLSFPRENLAKTQAETTGDIFGHCSRCVCSCGVWQSQDGSAWQLKALGWSTGWFHVLCFLFFERWGMSIVAFMVQTAENSLLHLCRVWGWIHICLVPMEGHDLVANVLWELPVSTQPGSFGRCGTLAVGTRCLNTLFCFIQRLHGDCLTFRQSLSKQNALPKEQNIKERGITIFRILPHCKICARNFRRVTTKCAQ